MKSLLFDLNCKFIKIGASLLALAKSIYYVLSTRICFQLKTQFFLYGYSFRPHVYDENDQWQRLFESALHSGNFWKRCFGVFVWTDENGTFRKRLGHTISSNPLRAILETYSIWPDGRFPFLSFIRGLISNLIACFQANVTLLILQADYFRRQQNVIRLLSLPVSRGTGSEVTVTWSEVGHCFKHGIVLS